MDQKLTENSGPGDDCRSVRGARTSGEHAERHLLAGGPAGWWIGPGLVPQRPAHRPGERTGRHLAGHREERSFHQVEAADTSRWRPSRGQLHLRPHSSLASYRPGTRAQRYPILPNSFPTNGRSIRLFFFVKFNNATAAPTLPYQCCFWSPDWNNWMTRTSRSRLEFRFVPSLFRLIWPVSLGK